MQIYRYYPISVQFLLKLTQYITLPSHFFLPLSSERGAILLRAEIIPCEPDVGNAAVGKYR